MNKLQKELGPKGLVVVGVTNESESEVTKDFEKSKMKHPILIVQGDDADRNYGIRGFPSGFLVDADGTIVWAGHPGNLEQRQIEALLDGLVLPPVLQGDFKDVNAQLSARKYGKALAAITKAQVKAPDDAELKSAAEFITKSLDTKLAAAKKAVEDKAYGDAMLLYTEILAHYEGVPGAEAGKTGIDELKKDKAAANDLAAFDRLQDATEQFRKGDLEKALKSYASIAKKYGDTPSGKRAAELVEAHGE